MSKEKTEKDRYFRCLVVRCDTKSYLIEYRRKIKLYLTPRHLDVASWICIIGNDPVESSSDNVLVRVTVNLKQASQDTYEKLNVNPKINLVTCKQRKAVDTLSPKWQVVRKQYSNLIVSMFVGRSGKNGSLKVSSMSIKWNVENPTNPLWKGRAEDARKSECHFVMEWIEMFVIIIGQTRYSTGNGAHFWLVLMIDKPVIKYNQRRC